MQGWSSDERPADGGLAARRAVVSWGWRLFRRDWRQQLLVLGLLTVAVAAAIFSVSAAYNVVPSASARFGTANHRLDFDGSDPRRLDAENTLRDVGVLYVATPELLRHLGLDLATVDRDTDVLTVHAGELRFANLSNRSEAAPGGRTDAGPAVKAISLPAYSSAPTSLITANGLRRGGWRPAPTGWLVEARTPPTSAQLAQPRQVAADAGMTVETRDGQSELTAIRSGATAAGMLLALGILAMTVGLIRGEAAGDLRTLTATGAAGATRRSLTAATGGALALLGALLGAIGAYLALVAGYHNDLGALGRVPVGHLAAALVGLPLTAAAAGWLLGGREPPALARRPLE